MGMTVIYGAIFGIIILICSPISFFILKRFGMRKLGFIVATILALIVIIPTISIALDGTFYKKKDVVEDLKLANLRLNFDFEIISNDVSGMPERYQFTKLKLTKNDRDRIISEIKNGVNFKVSSETDLLKIEMWDENCLRDKVVYTDYLYDNKYVRESYFRLGNYVPTSMTVFLSENSDTLSFSRIED